MKNNTSKFGNHDIVDVVFPTQAVLKGCTIVATHFPQTSIPEYDLMVPISEDEYAGMNSVAERFLQPTKDTAVAGH